jgi:hypothetical protein
MVTTVGKSMLKLPMIRRYWVYNSNGRNNMPGSHVLPARAPGSALFAAKVITTRTFINNSNITAAKTYKASTTLLSMHLLHVNGLTAA